MKKAVLSFGRLNPPTVGHEKLVTKVQELARRSNATPLVYLSHTQNVKKDPLSYADKITFARKAFGSLVIPTSARTIIEVLKEKKKLD
jgi:nicotinic acid mononucleotide adenylyltransferase